MWRENIVLIYCFKAYRRFLSFSTTKGVARGALHFKRYTCFCYSTNRKKFVLEFEIYTALWNDATIFRYVRILYFTSKSFVLLISLATIETISMVEQ